MSVEHFYQGIDGNFTFPDVYKLAASLPRGVGRTLACVEIGVANGRSAAFLAAELINAGHVHPQLGLVDNSGGNLSTAAHNLLPVAGLVDMHALCGNSWDMAGAYQDASLDFVFVDGEHAYEAVKKDIAAWLPKVRPGGILAGHDYVHEEWSGVIRAVTEAFEMVEVWRGVPWSDGRFYPSWLVRV
jgi:predicted O-methyltransferase YrrM